MKTATAFVAVLIASSAFAQDARFATVRAAFLVPADELSADKAVISCLSERLPKATPLTVTTTKADADVILTVAAKMHDSKATSILLGNNVIPEADIVAETPDGTRVWKGNTKGSELRAKRDTASESAACDLADHISDAVMRAMKKARDKK